MGSVPLALASLLATLLAFVVSAMLAALFGADRRLDIYYLAFTYPALLAAVFTQAAIATIVPMVSKVRGDDRRAFFTTVVLATLTVGIVGAAVFVAAAEQFFRVLAPKYSDGDIATGTRLLRIIGPGFCFLLLTDTLQQFLLAERRYWKYGIMSFVQPLVFLVALVVASVSHTLLQTTTLAMIYVGSLLVESLVTVILVVLQEEFRFSTFRASYLKAFLTISAPVFVGAFLGQINSLSDRFFSSRMPAGSITVLELANRVNVLPLRMIGVSLGLGVLPVFVLHINRKDFDQLHETLWFVLRSTIFLSLVTTVIMITFATPITRILFQHGSFSTEAVEKTAQVIRVLAIGLPLWNVVFILTRVFHAYSVTTIPLNAGILTVSSTIVLDVMVYRTFEVPGLAAATVIGVTVGLVYVLAVLWRRYPWTKARSQDLRFLLRLSTIATALAIAEWLLWERIEQALPTGLPWLVGTTLLGAGVSTLLFTASCVIVERDRMREIATPLVRKAKRATGFLARQIGVES